MNVISFRTLVATACAAVVCVIASPAPSATVADRPFQRFIARAPFDGDATAAPAPIDIVIQRWATSKDRSDLQDALSSRGPDGLLPGLHAMHRPVGVLLIPGVQNGGSRAMTPRPTNIWFADQIDTPNGRRVVLAADHYMAFGQPSLNWPAAYEFSLVDIRFKTDGTGVGKVAPATKVMFDPRTNFMEAANFDKLPVRLTGVQQAKLPQAIGIQTELGMPIVK
jgi:hypothetical protein